MKVRFIRDDLEISPSASPPKRLLVEKRVRRNKRMVVRRFWRLGAEWEHPKSYWLVRQGCAVPADAECAEACGMTEEDMAAAQKAFERVAKGIHPEDYAKFDAGEILGYDSDGNYIPGPNATTFDDDDGEQGDDLSGEY